MQAYNDIKNSIKTDYVPAKKIDILLLEGDAHSFGAREEIKLYSITNSNYPLVHELTHTLLGYGENFDSSSGYLTQEGFGDYMEYTYGKSPISPHKYMRYLIDENKIIPLFKLIDDQHDFKLFRPRLIEQKDYALMAISYIHAASFVTYLIDTYGLQKFEQVYNQKNLNKKLNEVYLKSTKELEEEWINYIRQNVEFASDDKLKIDGFYSLSSTIDSIDPEVFERDS